MQQFSFIDLFVYLFESAVHVSGDKLAHLQEHFLTVYTVWYNVPILLSTGDKAEMELHGVPSQLLVSPELCSMELFVFLRPPEFHIIPIAIFSKH